MSIRRIFTVNSSPNRTAPRRWLWVGLLLGTFSFPAQAADKTYLYAASSMTGVMTALSKEFQMITGKRIVGVFAASSTLARQIFNGAPANLFISANAQWMDLLARGDLLQPESRINIAGNRLVLAAPRTAGTPLSAITLENLLARLGPGRIAIADPSHVPAGIYAKQALQTLGLWTPLRRRLAIASNVRIAVAYVARGETPLGLVYASDLIARPAVVAVAQVPESAHTPIRYPLAIIKGRATPLTLAFVRVLQSAKGRAILEQFGFQRQ